MALVEDEELLTEPQPDSVASSRRSRLQRQREALLHLSTRRQWSSDDPARAWRDIVRGAAEALEVERVGIWIFVEQRRAIRGVTLYQRSSGTFLPESELRAADYPAYFAALEQQLAIDASRAADDLRTFQLDQSYLQPLGISSMLDVPIRVRGEVIGIVCHEHVGEPRAWHEDEISFVASIGALAALASETAEAERMRAQLQLASERNLQMLDNAADVIIVLDGEGRFESMNLAFRRVLGWRRRDWIGKGAAELVSPEDLPLLAAAEQRMRAGVTPDPFELRVRAASGAPMVLEVHISPRQDSDRVLGAVVVGRDVTRRRVAEDRAQALLEITRAMSEAHDVTAMLGSVAGPLGRALPCAGVLTLYRGPGELKSRVVAHHGIPPEYHGALSKLAFVPGEVLGNAMHRGETVVFNDVQSAPAAVQRVLAPFSVESVAIVPLRFEDRFLGSLVAVNVAGNSFDAGQIRFCETVGRQVSKAIEASEHSRAEQEEAEISTALVRVAQELISSLDTPTLLDRLCRVTAEVLRCDMSHTFMLRPETDTFIPVAGHGNTAQPWESLHLLEIPREMVGEALKYLNADGVLNVGPDAHPELVPASLSQAFGIQCGASVPLRRGDELVGSQTAGYVVGSSHRSFTAQQQRILRGIGQLASLALENARLVEQLGHANRVKSEFVAAMSHELRTPLNVIIGYTDLLREGIYGQVTGEQSEPLGKVAGNARDLLAMINATLDVNRMEMGRVTVEPEDTTLGAVAAKVDLAIDTPRATGEVSFRWEVEDPQVRARIDAGKVKTILRNLIVNAIKFTSRGEVVARMKLERDHLAIEVEDTGIGIPEGEREVIFEAFRQLDSPVSSQARGVGLGLYIVRRLVELLRGTVDVESEPGRGTLFRVRLPLA